MPHTGKPSGACLECKKRHVKCDETRPSCLRCMRGKRLCPGYTEGLDLVLRTQNDRAQRAVRKRERESKARRGDSPDLDDPNLAGWVAAATSEAASEVEASTRSSSESLPYPGRPSTLTGHDPKIVQQLYLGEDAMAIPFLIRTYSGFKRRNATVPGPLESLPMLLKNAAPTSAIYLSATASARLIYQAWERGMRSPETPQIQIAYGRALAATRAALIHPQQSLDDETLVSVFLLGFYENIADAFRSRVSSTTHYDGAVALFQHRWRHGVTTELSTGLLASARYHLISRAMVAGTSINGFDLFWQGRSEQVSYHPASALDTICIEVANMLAFAKDVSNDPTGSPAVPLSRSFSNNSSHSAHSSNTTSSGSSANSVATTSTTVSNITADYTSMAWTAMLSSDQIEDLLARAKDCEARLVAWTTLMHRRWYPVRMSVLDIPPSVVEAGLYGDFAYIYDDVFYALLWTDWRVARIRVLSIIARLDKIRIEVSADQSNPLGARKYSSIPSPAAVQAKKTIQQLVDAQCATIPFILGDKKRPAQTIFDMTAKYPWQKKDDEEGLKRHKLSAAAVGGWGLFVSFSVMLTVMPFLRPGQGRWIGAQFWRLGDIYAAQRKTSMYEELTGKSRK